MQTTRAGKNHHRKFAAFFTLGTAVLAKGVPVGADRVMRGIRYVAIFGLIHSVTEWSGMAKILSNDPLSLVILDRVIVISADPTAPFPPN